MLSRTTFIAGFGAGYVLGARAGKARYEQIAKLARSVAGNPAVRSTAGSLQTKVQSQASGLAGTARQRVTAAVSQKVGSRGAGSSRPTGAYDVVDISEAAPPTGNAGSNGRMGV